MNCTTQLLSPLLSSRDDILSTEVIRKDIFSFLEQQILDDTPGTSSQCMYLHGENGSGKTFLLLQFYYRLNKRVKVLYHDFKFSTSRQLQDLCMQIESGTISQKAVILADNFDIILNSTENIDHFHLRRLLSVENAPLFVASGRTVPDSFTRYDYAFYGFFKLFYLERLSIECCLSLATSICKISEKCSEDLLKLYNLLPRTPLVVLMITNELIMGRRSYDEILAGLTDRMNAYYESLLARLTPMARDILIVLLLNGPCALPKLRAATNAPGGTISAYLHMLIERGLVTKSAADARKSVYTAQDILMTKWAEKRFGFVKCLQ